jgi:coenzyme F420 biosynthesis associated uncharacterized protein
VIDWNLAGRVGGLVAGVDERPARARDDAALASLARDAAQRIGAHTGLRPDGRLPPPELVDRGEWIEANLAGMRATLRPLEDRMRDSAAMPGPAKAVGGVLLGAEVGGVVGLMGQRVLGQFELVLVDPDAPTRLLLVAPNLDEAAGRLEADPDDLDAWVLVHEVTHAVQFGAVTWLRAHLAGLIEELLGSVDVAVDPSALLRLPTAEDLRALVDAVRDGGLVHAVAGPERRALLDRVQAAMAMVEGHAEHVMDAVGAEVVDDVGALRTALDRRRRERPPALRLLERLLGLDMKMRQYELGRRFCDAVVEAEGMDGLNRAWSSPEALPTLAELEDPEAWRLRVVV